jgi:hypothetical protein
VLDTREPLIVHVWLSKSGETQVIRSRVPILQIAAADLDGDNKLELIAHGSDSKLHVWKRKHRGFHSYRRRDAARSSIEGRNCRSFDGNETEPLGEDASTPYAPFALTLCASARAPGREASNTRAHQTVRAFHSFAAVDPFAPRPPPAAVPL